MIIYKITNLINNKIYIGQSNNKRKSYLGGGKLLKFAQNKYGRENFKKEVLIKGDFDQELTDLLEIEYIEIYNSIDLNIGYNIESGGMGGRCKVYSEERKLKQSISMEKRFSNPNERYKLSVKMKSYMTIERRNKISKDLSKRVISEQTREKLRLAKRGNQSKGIIEVYKNNIKVFEFISFQQCCKQMHFSLRTIRPLLNTDKEYKDYKFKRIPNKSK